MSAWLKLLVVLFTVSTTGCACACTCALEGTPSNAGCSHVQPHGDMVLGLVLRQRVVGREEVHAGDSIVQTGGRRIVTLAVIDDFSGKSQPGQEIEVETGMGNGDCGYRFLTGERYLVDVGTNAGKLMTSICSQTMPEARAAVMIRELRAKQSRSRLPDLSGAVIQEMPHAFRQREDQEGPRPVPDIPVTLTRTDGQQFHAETGADGVYAVQTLPPGGYTVSLTLPDTFLLQSTSFDTQTIRIPETGGTGAGCEADLAVSYAGTISGQVTGTDGKGVAGWVYAYSTEQNDDDYYSWDQAADVGADGVFKLGLLAPGTYRIRFESVADRKAKWYYPGTPDRADARLVTVGAGVAVPLQIMLNK